MSLRIGFCPLRLFALLLFVMAHIIKYGANKSKDDPDKYGPPGNLVPAAVNNHRIRVNRVNYRPEINN